MSSRLVSRSCKTFARSCVYRQAVNDRLLRPQARGIRIKKFFVHDDFSKPAKIDRSYDLLVAETVTDLDQHNRQDAPPLAGQAGDELPESSEPSKWDLIKQKCDYTLSTKLP